MLEVATPPDEVRYALAGRQWLELLERPTDAWLPAVLRALASLGVPAAEQAPGPNSGEDRFYRRRGDRNQGVSLDTKE